MLITTLLLPLGHISFSNGLGRLNKNFPLSDSLMEVEEPRVGIAMAQPREVTVMTSFRLLDKCDSMVGHCHFLGL